MPDDAASAEAGSSRLPEKHTGTALQRSRSPDNQPAEDEPRKRAKSSNDNAGSANHDSISSLGSTATAEDDVKPFRAARPYWPLRRSCQQPLTVAGSIYAYERLNHIQEGTYGVVFRARSRTSKDPVNAVKAVKKLKLDSNTMDSDGFPISSLREILTLRLARGNKEVVELEEVCVGKTLDQVFLVMEFMEHDLKSLMLMLHKKGSGWAMSEIKLIMHQLTSAVAGLHADWIVHRDLKSSNVLMDNRGNVKLADFGLARRFSDPPLSWTPPSNLRSKSNPSGEGNEDEDGGMTDLVVTLWYRAPELLLLNQMHEAHEARRLRNLPPHQPMAYNEKIDIWSLGCIFAELLLTPTTGRGLLQGKDEPTQLILIDKTLGPFDSPAEERRRNLEKALKNTRATKATLDLMAQMFEYLPRSRIAAKDALEHEWFTKESPKMAHRDSMPTFPSAAAAEGVKKTAAEPSAPNPHMKKERNTAEKKGKGKANGGGYEMEFDFDL